MSTCKTSFDLVHLDIWGPSPPTTMGGSRYFIIFVDDFSQYTWIYLMHHMSDLSAIYREFADMIKTQFSRTIKILRTDNVMEYKEHSFLDFFHQNGTVVHRSCPGTSSQNGRAERKHRHILDTIRALLISASCSEQLWGEAALTAVYTINRVSSSVINNQTPYERLFQSTPDYTQLKIFGCACFVLLQPHEHHKLESRARLCCFLGYGNEHKGYRCWDPLSKRLRISRQVVFWEHKMFSSMSKFHLSITSSILFINPSSDLFPDEPIVESSHDSPTDDSTHDHAPPEDPASAVTSELSPPALRRSNRVRANPTHLRDFHYFSIILYFQEPTSYREASSNPVW
ncbi:hypothetical protein ACH5RR_041431 [Cinchona calisaya]|uniref:Integrase catalytic domain-containing protein n=1 Tax=Cinchona calisaya TaxID=153742 RepID=A0ABD2XWV1_9GENT